MKIIFLGRYNPSEALTGPEKVAKRIFTEYTKAHRAAFIEYFFDGRKYGIVKKLLGNEVLSENNDSQVFRMGLFSMLTYLVKTKPDVIHIITYERFGLAAFLYKVFSKVKIVYNIHGIIIHENTKYKNVSLLYFLKDKLCERIYLRNSDRLIFLSQESVDIASKYYRIDLNKVTVLSNGVDEIFHSKGKDKHYTIETTLKLLFNGSIERKEKGFTFLNETLKNSDVPFELYLSGNSKKSGEENYLCIPFTDTKTFAELLSGMDVFISASEYEPFSITATEAMAAGVVPVVSKETGMSRYIQNNVNGFVFNFGDMNELNNILKQIYSDGAAIQMFSERSKEIYNLLNWETICTQYKDLYRTIMNT